MIPPKHGSWFNLAERKVSVLLIKCLDRSNQETEYVTNRDGGELR